MHAGDLMLLVVPTFQQRTSTDINSRGFKMAIKKVIKSTAEASKRTRRAPESYKNYISKVLKQVHPQTRISKKGVAVINSFVADTFDRIAMEASKLCRMTKRATMGSREVQSAIRLVLPGELAKHAVSEGTKAMTKFSQA